jgi:hypothetical protein
VDAQKFDTLARALGSTATRRVALRTLGAGTLAAMIGLRSGDAGAATCRSRQRLCTSRRQCCGHKNGVVCRPLNTGSTCESGNRCCGTAGTPCANNQCNCCEGFACSAVTFKCEKFP